MNNVGAFSAVEVKNCRRFLKKCYTLSRPVDTGLIKLLGEFGVVEIEAFSQRSELANDYFKIKFEECFQIDGVIKGNDIYVTVAKGSLELFNEIELRFNNWYMLS